MHPSWANNALSISKTSQHANPVSCQLSAISCQLSFILHRGPRLWNVSSFPITPLFTRFLVLLILLPPLLQLLIPSLCTRHTLHCTSSTTIYIRHPPCNRFPITIYQTHTIYQISHNYLSDTRSISRAPFLPLFTRFRRAPPHTAIYTLFFVYSHTAHTT